MMSSKSWLSSNLSSFKLFEIIFIIIIIISSNIELSDSRKHHLVLTVSQLIIKALIDDNYRYIDY